ncbi:coproporphyrinogen-III oxidase family protein [Streptomyces sp. MB09-01]|uniref:coproporphyrinogen-III oxidase family protein n=1 Tax=Streptomyces sp. MB09-01 TaxID=3028666 RepID=UPI0029A8873A|nr:coproporphyrinogen-III oxidase family protein [Streptomyces sp. MB09-01]MDX3537876.1 coproporphyrinogen-III oxidase family protein [Streptomyces sp. MB09-01]
MVIPASELRRRIKDDNDRMALDADTAARIENLYGAVDWQRLAEKGFDKHGDYCFIYSYPPVRTLRSIPPDAMFQPSAIEPVTDRLNVYLHIPYCSGICSYCYFAKVVDNNNAPVLKDEYIDLLIGEMDMKLSRYNPAASIGTVHFGGGTPSTLEPRQIRRIMAYLRGLPHTGELEVTFECAPETVHADLNKLRVLRDNGVTRINLGVESLDDRVLKIMARRHGSDMTLRSLENIREAGFNNINVDLIYALPGQSTASWVATMREICRWGLESVSVYRLRRHPMKRISKLEQDLYPSYEDGLRMQLAHGLVMGDGGYLRVQSHKYARRREVIQQQTERKRGVDATQLLSVGCGAYGFLNSTFYWNTKSLGEWAAALRENRHPTWIGQTLTPQELMRKTFALGVHTSSGIPRSAFARKFGADPLEVFTDEIRTAEEAGLFEVTDDAVRPTELGYFFGDELSILFYSPTVRAELDALGMKYGMFFEQDRYA